VVFPDTSDSIGHRFIITFHDSTFECIARGLKASFSTEPYEKIFAETTMRAFGRHGGA